MLNKYLGTQEDKLFSNRPLAAEVCKFNWLEDVSWLLVIMDGRSTFIGMLQSKCSSVIIKFLKPLTHFTFQKDNIYYV